MERELSTAYRNTLQATADPLGIMETETKQPALENKKELWILDPQKVTRCLISCWGVIIGLHILQLIVFYSSGSHWRFLDMNKEFNLPTYAQGLQLLAAAVILIFIFHETRSRQIKGSHYWFSLSLIFAYLSLDEVLRFHERINGRLESLSELSPSLHFPWVIVYGPLTVIVGLYYLVFLFTLQRKWRNRFIVAGFIFVGGALGMEIIGGHTVASLGRSWEYSLVNTVEEAMEIFGIAYFIVSLLQYRRSLPALNTQNR